MFGARLCREPGLARLLGGEIGSEREAALCQECRDLVGPESERPWLAGTLHASQPPGSLGKEDAAVQDASIGPTPSQSEIIGLSR